MFGYDTFGTTIFHAVGQDSDYSGATKVFSHCKDDTDFDGGVKLLVGGAIEDQPAETDACEGTYRIPNDSISSLWVKDGETITLYEHCESDANFPGDTITFIGPLAVHCLTEHPSTTENKWGNMNWNDKTSHIKVEVTSADSNGSTDPNSDVIYGCLVTNATNYDETATEDDGSCVCEEGFELNTDNTECVESGGLSSIIKYALYAGVGLTALLLIARR